MVFSKVFKKKILEDGSQKRYHISVILEKFVKKHFGKTFTPTSKSLYQKLVNFDTDDIRPITSETTREQLLDKNTQILDELFRLLSQFGGYIVGSQTVKVSHDAESIQIVNLWSSLYTDAKYIEFCKKNKKTLKSAVNVPGSLAIHAHKIARLAEVYENLEDTCECYDESLKDIEQRLHILESHILSNSRQDDVKIEYNEAESSCESVQVNESESENDHESESVQVNESENDHESECEISVTVVKH